MLFTETEKAKYKLSEAEVTMAENLSKMIAGEEGASVNFSEALASPSAAVLIPKVVVGAMRQAAEPLYIGSKLLQKVRFQGQGNSMIFPSIGVMRAFDVAEGQEIPEDTIDWQTHETPEIRIGKSGVRVRFTQEMVTDSQWDIISMLIKEAGRAMGRLKEQKIFQNFSKYGHKVFDNLDANPEAHTSGLDIDGNKNGTMSAEDFLDLIIAVMGNEYTPSDILMHPLAWTVFARNELTGALAKSPNDMYPHKGTPKSMALGPDSIQGRLPFAFNVQLSPFIPLDKKAKRFDMYVVDRNNIGVLLEKQGLQTEEFNEPARDIKNLKITERYGIGVLNEGKAVAVAKNISMVKSYNEPQRVINITK
jgi:hypothetical protein